MGSKAGLTAIGYVELDAKIPARAAWVMTGGENDPSNSFNLSDDARHGRSGQNSIVSDDQPPDLQEGGSVLNLQRHLCILTGLIKAGALCMTVIL